MIIHCPKCNFEQPKIEFCANCGINIDSYKKKPPKWSERISKNSLTYLIFIFLIFLGSGLFIKSQWFAKSPVKTAFQPAEPKEIIKAKQNERAPASENKALNADNNKNDAAPSEPKAVLEEESKNPYLKIEVYEIPVSYLSFFSGKVLNARDLSEITILYVEEVYKEYLERLQKTKALFKTDYFINAFQKPFLIQQSVYSEIANDDLGFYVNVTIDSFREENLLIRLNVSRNFYLNSKENVLNFNKIDESLNFQEGDTYILYNLLPHREVHPNEELLFQEGYLAMMNSDAFQNLENSLAILFTYKY